MNPENLSAITQFLSPGPDELLEENLLGQTCILPLPVMSWKGILGGNSNSDFLTYMVEMLHNAVSSTLVTLQGWIQGKSFPVLTVDPTKVL